MAAAEDLADRLDDLICSFDKAASAAGEALDASSLLVIVAVWLLVGGAVLLFASAAYGRTGSGEGAAPSPSSTGNSLNQSKDQRQPSPRRPPSDDGEPVILQKSLNGFDAQEEKQNGHSASSSTTTTSKAAVKVPIIAVHPPPASVGSDSEATAWVNACLARLWSSQPKATELLVRRWQEALSALQGCQISKPRKIKDIICCPIALMIDRGMATGGRASRWDALG